jgi:nucleoside-diphosphate-sugar epimerase
MREDHPRGGEAKWGAYATGKLEAERELVRAAETSSAAFVILRPPYL